MATQYSSSERHPVVRSFQLSLDESISVPGTCGKCDYFCAEPSNQHAGACMASYDLSSNSYQGVTRKQKPQHLRWCPLMQAISVLQQ